MPWGTIILAIAFTTVLTLATPYFISGTSASDLFFKQYVPYFSVALLAIIVIFGWLGKHK